MQTLYKADVRMVVEKAKAGLPWNKWHGLNAECLTALWHSGLAEEWEAPTDSYVTPPHATPCLWATCITGPVL